MVLFLVWIMLDDISKLQNLLQKNCGNFSVRHLLYGMFSVENEVASHWVKL